MAGYAKETTLLRRDLARITDRIQTVLREAAKKDKEIKKLKERVKLFILKYE